MENLEELTLIDKTQTRCYEKILIEIIKILGYGFGSICHIPYLVSNGWKPTEKAYKMQSIIYLENEEKIYRNPLAANELQNKIKNCSTLNQYLMNSAKLHPKRHCFGRRKLLGKKEHKDPVTLKNIIKYTFGEFVWKTYKEVLHEMECLSRSLIDYGFDEDHKLALFCNTSPDWLTMAFACFNVSLPFVTVYSSLSDEAIEYAFGLTEVYGVMVDEKTLPRIMKFSQKLTSLKYIITSKHVENIDTSFVPLPDPIVTVDISVLSKYTSETDPYCRTPEDSNNMALIMFTSGSSGIPKGVMISHQNIIAVGASIVDNNRINKSHVYPAFLPSSHIFEFFIEVTMVLFGSTIGFCTPLTLLDTSPMIQPGTRGDLTMLKPTLMITVPLFLERVQKGVIDSLKTKSRFKQILFQTCFSMKKFYRMYGFNTPILDKVIFKPLRNILGGKIELAFIGGAKISRNTSEFAASCFGDFKEGYGLTETSSAVMVTDFNYFPSGTAGCPLPHCEIKLLPWEEGGCDPNDKKTPRGEIAVCGDCVTLGYYKNQELTDASYVVDKATGKRWFLTGDIAQVTSDGCFMIIDRKKDIIKLSHGEYSSLVKIETLIGSNPLVDIVCVLPTHTMSHLVALIIPNRERSKKFLVQNGMATEDQDIETILSNTSSRECIAENVKAGLKDGLNRYELPQAFHVLEDIWTPESNLITPTIKLKRTEIRKRYSALLI